MHDDIIISYSMDFKNKKMEMHTYNNLLKCKSRIEFEGILTHFFTGSLNVNQILDIDEWSINAFIEENEEYLKEMKRYCWPIKYQNLQDLSDYLIINKYKYIKIVSAYGMFGWVLAKDFQIYEVTQS